MTTTATFDSGREDNSRLVLAWMAAYGLMYLVWANWKILLPESATVAAAHGLAFLCLGTFTWLWWDMRQGHSENFLDLPEEARGGLIADIIGPYFVFGIFGYVVGAVSVCLYLYTGEIGIAVMFVTSMVCMTVVLLNAFTELRL